MKFTTLLLSIFTFMTLISSCKNDDDTNLTDNIENFPATHFIQIEDFSGSLTSVSATIDGGFILTGEMVSNNIPLVKLAADCSLEWKKEFGGTERDTGNEVRQTSEGNYIIAGFSRSFGAGQNDAYVLLTDSSGGEYWSRTFGSTDADQMKSVVETTDGNFIAVGFTENGFDKDLSIFKLNNQGLEIDSRIINRTFSDIGLNIVDVGNDEFGILGLSQNMDASGQLLIMKIDINLDTIWTTTFNGLEYFGGAFHDMIATNDGGFLAIANSQGLTTNDDLNLVMIKVNSEGVLEWRKEYEGNTEEFAHAVVQTSDNGYLAVSGTGSIGNGELDWMLTKTDELGNELWSKTYGGAQSDSPHDIVKTDGGYLICGSSRSLSDNVLPAMVVLKVDEEGMPK